MFAPLASLSPAAGINIAIEFCKIEEFDSIKLLLDTAVYTAYPKCPTVNYNEFKKYRNFHTLYSMHSRR
jgi:hypothetical protein